MARTTGSDELYRLIHSLTTEEKGYFKKFAKRHTSEGNKYLQLFDAVNKQTEFEEERLKKKFKGYADMKRYLFNSITESLVLYHNNSDNPFIYLSMCLSRAQVMEQKGMVKQALGELERGLDFMAKSEQIQFQHLFVSYGYSLKKLPLNIKDQYNLGRETYYELSKLIGQLQSTDRFIFEKNKMLCYIFKNLRQADVDIDKSDLDFEYFQNIGNAKSTLAKRLYYEIGLEYFHHISEPVKEYNLAIEFLKYSKQLLNLTPGYGLNYSRALSFAAKPCATLGKIEEAEKYYTEMRDFKTTNKRFNARVPFNYVNQMMRLYATNHLFEKGYHFTLHAQRNYPQAFEKNKNNFYYDSICAYTLFFFFYVKDFRKVVELLNDFDKKLIEFKSPVYLRDMEMLRLMLQVELKNYDLLHGLTKSVVVRLKKLGMLGVLEKIMLRFFTKIPKGNTKVLAQKTLVQLNSIDPAQFGHSITNRFLDATEYADWVKVMAGK